jgi:hypothetical protein
MKNLFVLPVFVLLAYTAAAKNYYIAANGSDANTGISTTAPWKTITKLNASFSAIVAGDSILFRSGDTFYGAIVVGKSGSSGRPIVFSSYGTGAKPVITGFVTASSWVNISTGVYQVYMPGAKSTLNMVALNNVPQALGRYPNTDVGNGGYLYYESHSGSTSITDNQLTTATNWVGAEVVIRKKLWVLDRCKVTAHSGGTLTFTNIGSSYEGTNGYGYFIQNDVRTLDKLGEWYLNKTTKYLQMYFGTASPSSYTVKVSCIDTLINLSSKTYINISNLVFEGANGNSLFSTSGNYVNITNCDFINSGVAGIQANSTSNFLIENCTVSNSHTNGIVASSTKSTNVTIRSCAVKNTGVLPGMGASGGNSYKSIMAGVLSNLLVEYNTVDTSGYVGIDFQGSNVTIKNNVVDHFDFIKDDAGGIYTYSGGTDAAPGTVYTNRVIKDNIVMNGMGAGNGRNSTSPFVSGIYLDGRTVNVDVLNNTVFNNGKNGIHCSNANNVTIRGNTSFNNLNAVSVLRWANVGVLRNLYIKNNILYTKTESQRSLHYVNTGLNEPATTTVNVALRSMASIDSNTYSMINQAGFNFEVYGTTGGALVATSPYSLEGWQTAIAHDLNGRKTPKLPMAYKVTSLVGTNRFTNALFSSSISGFSIYGTTSSGVWDNTGKINGGSLKISVTTPGAGKYTSLISSLGAVSSSKKYVLRFSTYGTSNQGIVRAYIRKTASPYTNLVTTQVKSFSIGRKDHEFLFNAPTTDAGSSFVIEIEQTSGTTYIDNVEFYEAAATLYDTESQLRFEYNETRQVKTIALDATYTGVNGTQYSGTISLQPYTSIILVKDTGTVVVVPPPVSTSLKTTGTATAINCYGGSSTVTVAATGGTAPYTGTGTFIAPAGKGALKLSFPVSRAGVYASMYYAVGAVSSSKNYVLKFSTLGTTGTGTVIAGIRQTFTPWSTITSTQTATFGNTRQDFQFVFKAPPTQTAASFLIQVEQASGTTYIDNIAFFECDTAGAIVGPDLYTYGQLETGISRIFVYSGNGNHTAVWDTTGKINSTYYYTVRDAANSVSVVPVTVTQPSAPVSVTASAGLISVLGGTASVVVTATGGTAPYTGTGTFSSLLAGTYTYTVSDALGCSVSKTATVLPFAAARPATTTSARIANNAIAATASKTLQLTAYPNPFRSSLNLQLKGGTNEKVSISVYSFDSKLVYQTTGNTNDTYTLGNKLMAGVYIVKVLQGGNMQTVKVVKTTN